MKAHTAHKRTLRIRRKEILEQIKKVSGFGRYSTHIDLSTEETHWLRSLGYFVKDDRIEW